MKQANIVKRLAKRDSILQQKRTTNQKERQIRSIYEILVMSANICSLAPRV